MTRIGLHADLRVCGEAAGEDEALNLVRQQQPDLVLIDIALKSGHGIDLIQRIRSQFPAIKMLVISGFSESLYAERALRAGASGFLHKQETSEQLIAAIRTVLRGERYVSPELSQRLLNLALQPSSALPRSPIESLTKRELEVFRLIGEGVATGEIAERLQVSPHTIDTHRENIKRKLNLHTAAELARAAVQWVLETG